jgi:hypothetical protein
MIENSLIAIVFIRSRYELVIIFWAFFQCKRYKINYSKFKAFFNFNFFFYF